jgi:translation initiation factor 4A
MSVVNVNVNENVNKNENVNENSKEETFSSWDELDIDQSILRGIYAYGFEKPSPIQSKAVIPIYKGHDIIAQAQSGTGKTAAFTIGALSRVDLTENFTQVLVMSPTHELTRQISAVIQGLSSMMNGLRRY